MNKHKMIRAWKDEDYRNSLSEEERKALPDHPAGIMELSDEELGLVSGQAEDELAWTTIVVTTIIISLNACPSAEGTCDHGTDGCCGVAPSV